MSERRELSPERTGAEVLALLARGRADATLTWQRPSPLLLRIKAGRPARLDDAAGRSLGGKVELVRVVRAFAVAASGAYTLTPLTGTVDEALAVDPLGESLIGVLGHFAADDIDLVTKARHGAYRATSAFTRLAAAARAAGAPVLPVPTSAFELPELLGRAELNERRAWMAVLFLGGLEPVVAGAEAPTPRAEETRTTPLVEQRALPADPRLRAVVQDIQGTHARMMQQNHYEVLGLKQSATADDVKKAYFALAKRWHSDSFPGMDLGAAQADVEEIFRRVGEANRILSTADERKAYDFMLDRQRQGLPTDPAVILEAESLFKKGEALVRRGQAVAALPLLERAVAMNKGEPEFFVYLGFALYNAKGASVLAEAEKHIQTALKMRETLDVAYEFLGRIAHVEGDFDKAKKHLTRALDLNPKNRDAERELRLITQRGGKAAPQGAQSLPELLGKLFKKS